MTDEDTSTSSSVPARGAAPRCALVVDADLAPGLAASRAQLAALRAAAVEAGVFVVDLPAAGQQTTDYQQLSERLAQLPASEVECIGVGICGGARAVRRLTGTLPLLR